jgi:OPA family glycerol-3-phosphate transporter-like MFS transporter
MQHPTTPEMRVLKSTGLHAWQLIAFFAAGSLYLTCYFARYNLSPATPDILADFEYTNEKFGWITTFFTIFYAAGQFINGWLADRFGPRRLLIVGGFGCVAANVCFGLSNSFFAFAASWAANAYFSSMLWSPSCRIVYNWFPRNRWGFWKGALLTMSFAGGAFGMPLTALVIENYGWRAAFFIPPAFLLGTTVVFFFLGRNSPRDAGFQPQWEETIDPAESERKSGLADYVAALSNFKMNLAYLAGAGEKMVRIGIITWFIVILKEPVDAGGFGLTLEQSSMMTSLAFWGGVALCIPVGLITDRVFRGQRWQTMVIGFLVSAAGLACLAQVDFILSSPHKLLLIGAAIFVCGGTIQAMETPLYVLPGQILGKERGATGVGIMGGCMYVGASASGAFLGWWLDNYSVSSMLLLLAGVCVFSSFVSATIRR